MDIRSFFGGPKKQPPTNESISVVINTKNSISASEVTKRRRVIEDDDDEEATPLASDPTTLEKVLGDFSPPVPKENVIAQHVDSAPSTIAVNKVLSPRPLKEPIMTENLPQSIVPKDVSEIITWKSGESIPYSALVDTFDAISRVSGRLDKENLFCRLFRAVILTTPADLDTMIYLASNCVAPAYEGLELGIGDSLLVKAVCEATGRRRDAVEEDYEREGDLGNVALASRASQKTLSFAAKPKPLSAVFVLQELRAITMIKVSKLEQNIFVHDFLTLRID